MKNRASILTNFKTRSESLNKSFDESPDLTILLNRLASSEKTSSELKEDLRKMSAANIEKDKVISDCRKQLDSLTSERDRLSLELTETAQNLLAAPKSIKSSSLTSSPESAALKEFLALREAEIAHLSNRVKELETQNAAMRTVVEVELGSRNTLYSEEVKAAFSNGRFNCMTVLIPLTMLRYNCYFLGLLEQKLLDILCQTLEDAKLLNHLQDSGKSENWESGTWHDFSNSWRHIATSLLETLEQTHRAFKLKN